MRMAISESDIRHMNICFQRTLDGTPLIIVAHCGIHRYSISISTPLPPPEHLLQLIAITSSQSHPNEQSNDRVAGLEIP